MRYKICPSCRRKNPVEELLCEDCMTDLSNARIIEEPEEIEETEKTEESLGGLKEGEESRHKEGEESRHIGELTRIEVKEKLILKHDEFSIEVLPGDIVGRHTKGSEYLKDYPTVSRMHAKFYRELDGWYVEDLNSTNGTFVNGKKINTKVRIKNGDTISFSSSVSFIVFIDIDRMFFR